MIEMNRDYYNRLPKYAWIARTIPNTILEGVSAEVQEVEEVKEPPKPKQVKLDIKRDGKILEGFDDVIHFKPMGDIGYYCATLKGHHKARRHFSHGLTAEVFNKTKRVRCDNEPRRFPCITKFYLDPKTETIQVQYNIDKSNLHMLGKLRVNK